MFLYNVNLGMSPSKGAVVERTDGESVRAHGKAVQLGQCSTESQAESDGSKVLLRGCDLISVSSESPGNQILE